MTQEEFKALIYPLTAQEVADMSGYSFRTVQGWLQGRPVPNSFAVSHAKIRELEYLLTNSLDNITAIKDLDKPPESLDKTEVKNLSCEKAAMMLVDKLRYSKHKRDEL